MKCSRCQHDNPAGTKFCGQCAAPLASTCTTCGAANPPDNKFCGQCAAPLGRLDEAQRLADRAVHFSPRHAGFAAHAQHLLGDIATHPDRFDADRGEAHYRQALALAEPRGMRPLVAHCHLGLGKLYRRTGKRQEAQEHLTIATTLYREMDMRFWLEEVERGSPSRSPE